MTYERRLLVVRISYKRNAEAQQILRRHACLHSRNFCSLFTLHIALQLTM